MPLPNEKHVGEVDAKVLAAFPHRVWNCSTARLGYSGTALFARSAPLSVWSDPFALEAFANEGRVVAAEFAACFVVGVYAPNSGDGLARLRPRTEGWDPAAAAFLADLESRGKPVVYCGDLNVAHAARDLWGNHAANEKSAGYTPEEREAFGRLLVGPRLEGGLGLVDSFRAVHPTASAYSYFSYRGEARKRNRGWRIDYALVSRELGEGGRIHDAYIRGDVGGSDHCPVGVVLKGLRP